MHGMVPWPWQERLVRRTITIDGRQTGIALDNRFWQHLDRMAAEQGIKTNDLVRRLCHRMRRQSGRAGILRLAVVADLESRITDYDCLYRRKRDAADQPAVPAPLAPTKAQPGRQEALITEAT